VLLAFTRLVGVVVVGVVVVATAAAGCCLRALLVALAACFCSGTTAAGTGDEEFFLPLRLAGDAVAVAVAVLHSTVLHSTVLHSTVLHSTAAVLLLAGDRLFCELLCRCDFASVTFALAFVGEDRLLLLRRAGCCCFASDALRFTTFTVEDSSIGERSSSTPNSQLGTPQSSSLSTTAWRCTVTAVDFFLEELLAAGAGLAVAVVVGERELVFDWRCR